MEAIYGTFTKHILSRFSANTEIDTPVLGTAMNKAGQMGTQALLSAGIGQKVNLGKEGQEALVINNAAAAKLASLT